VTPGAAKAVRQAAEDTGEGRRTGLEDGLHYNFLGNAYLSSGRSTDALHAYQEAIRLDPNYATAYLNLAVFYLHSGQPDQARPYYQKACRLDRNFADNSNRSSIKRDAPARAGSLHPILLDRLEVKLDAEARRLRDAHPPVLDFEWLTNQVVLAD